MSTGWIIATIVASPVAMIAFADIVYRVWITSRIRGLIESVPPFGVVEVGPAFEYDDVLIPRDDGGSLAASIYRPAGKPTGLVIFSHELQGNRHTATRYVSALMEAGLAVVSFDYSNHGDSFSRPDYSPVQWITEVEVEDLQMVINWTQSLPEFQGLKLGIFGVSKGGSVVLLVASQRSDIAAVATESAYSTRSLIHAFTDRFSRHVCPAWIFDRLPAWHIRQDVDAAIRRSARQNQCRYEHLESTASRLTADTLLIFGARDSYVTAAVRNQLQNILPKQVEYWVVPKAQHNRARDVSPTDYDKRLKHHFQTHLSQPNSSNPASS